MLTEPETIKGLWWLATNPETKLQGEITYGPTNGATIDLYGDFRGGFDECSQNQRFTLQGETLRGEAVTLFDCIVMGGNQFLPGGSACKVGSTFGIVGRHLANREEIFFKEVRARFTQLRNWVCTSGIQFRPTDEKGAMSINYKLPELINLGEYNGLSVQIENGVNIKTSASGIKIEEDKKLLIRSPSMRTFSEFDRLLRTFQTFLTLAMQHPIYCIDVIGHTDEPQMVLDGSEIFEDIGIIRSISDEKSRKDDIIPMEQLFNMKELTTDPASVFCRFVEREEILRPSMELYFSTNFYNRSGLPRITFLMLAQSLEAYHRLTISGKYMGDDDFRNGLRDSLWKCVASFEGLTRDFKASLGKKLDYLHEYSLRKRVKDLAEKNDVILRPLIGEPQSFATEVSDLRNNLTHLGPGSTDVGRDYKKVLSLAEKLSLLLETCYLSELGISQDAIKRIIFQRSKTARRVQRGVI